MTKEGKKESINCGTIGHVDHGKTTLTASLGCHGNKGKKYTIDEIDNHKEEKARGITINSRSIRYHTPKREINHTDCPGHRDFVKNMIAGSSNLDVVILLVTVVDGPQQQTKEHIKIAAATKIPHIIVALNKMDQLGEEEKEIMPQLVREETAALLKENGYNERQFEFIEISATTALKEAQEGIEANFSLYGVHALNKIFDAIDRVDLGNYEERNKQPFCLIIEETYSIQGRGVVVSGKVSAGMLLRSTMSKLEIIPKGRAERILVDVTELQIFHKTVESGSTGDNLAILVKGVERHELSRGDVVTVPGGYPSFYFAQMEFHLFSAAEGGRKTSIGIKYTPHIFCGPRDAPAEIIDIEGEVKIIEPGSTGICWVVFGSPMIEDPHGKSFIIRESNSTIGYGVILKTSQTPPIAITENAVKGSQVIENMVRALKIKVVKSTMDNNKKGPGVTAPTGMAKA